MPRPTGPHVAELRWAGSGVPCYVLATEVARVTEDPWDAKLVAQRGVPLAPGETVFRVTLRTGAYVWVRGTRAEIEAELRAKGWIPPS